MSAVVSPGPGRRLLACAVISLVASGVPSRASAQEAGRLVERPAASCADGIPPAAYSRVVVYGTTWLTDSALAPDASRLLRFSADALLQTAGERVRALLRPAGTLGDVLPRGEPALGDSLRVWRGVGAPLVVTAYRDGHVTWQVPAGRPDTLGASFLARGLAAASEAHALGFVWPPESTLAALDSVQLKIGFRWREVDHAGNVDTMPPPHPAEPLFSMLAPWRDALHLLHTVPPVYPRINRETGYAGAVVMRLVVDTSGRAKAGTVRDFWPPGRPELTGGPRGAYDDFVRATRAALLASRFEPERVGGCPVEVELEMHFSYSLGP